MSQRTQKVMFAITILLNASISHADEVANCVATQNNTERLACYDALFMTDTPALTTTKPTATVPQRSDTSDTPAAANQDPAILFGKEQIETTARKPDDSPRLNELASTVAKLSRLSRNELVVYLENEQVWGQISPRYLTVKIGDGVIIRRGRMGGYILTTERGGSTRVKRIR